MKERIDNLNKKLSSLNTEEIIISCFDEFKGELTFASSLSLEDQVITHIIANLSLNIPIFTLDTGRLFYETYDLIERTESKYKLKININFPDFELVEDMTNEKGVNLFYHSIENRKYCCRIRKIEPLQRALSGYKAWICGLRKDQSITRKNTNIVEWDATNQLIKINPLLNWNDTKLNDFIHTNKIPYNTLHDKGFPSIGCAPCTRAIEKGEDIRAGRWWWESPETKECGLHKK